MRALVLRRPETLELVEAPRPTLTDDRQVLVRVKACGICGSDVRYWAGENPWAMHTLGRHVDNPPNMVLGHEFAGVVVEVRSPEFEHLIGERVGVQAFRTCGECALCTTGRENLCRDTIHIGHAQGWGVMDFYPGAYAEYCLAWGDVLHPMDDHVPFEQEAMRDILGVAVHVVGRAVIRRGEAVLCIGGGPAGLCIAQVAKVRGAGEVFVSDPSPLARRVVGQFEALTCIDPTTQSIADVLRERLGQAAVAVVYDSVGSAETMREALSLLAESGTYVNLAVHNTSLELNALSLGSERTITTSSNALYRDEREAHGLIRSGAVDVGAMITHRFPLEDYRQAFDLLLRDPKEAYKIVFTSF
jgi:threonine dehydrogenase-like Zn-dependent dehydrogenase